MDEIFHTEPDADPSPDPLLPVQPRGEDGGTVSELMDDWLASMTSEPTVEATAAPVAPATLLAALADVPQAPDESEEHAAAPAADPARLQRYVLVTVAGSTYGVRDLLVTEIGRVPKITMVPHTPPWVRGVTSLRGDVLSVIDLRTFLSLEPTSAHSGRLIVARLADEDFAIGILVDGVDQIASVPLEGVRPPASPLEGALASFLTGVCQVGDRFVAVLDLDRLLRSPEIRQFEDRTDVEAGAAPR